MINIVNIKSGQKYDVYCGRANKTYNVQESIFHNPFIIGKHGDRAEVINMFKAYFYDKIKNPDFKQKVLELKYKTCACWCKFPDEDCHLRIIKEYLESYEQEGEN